MLNRGLDKQELLRIVDAVANEKSIDKELVISSMESAIQKAALTKFGNDNTIEVKIDRESGEITIQKVLDIVENVQDSSREISIKQAQKLKDYKPRDYLLLTGDPAIIGVACSIVSDITNGKFNLVKWDKQERKYYPIEINLYERGEIDDN